MPFDQPESVEELISLHSLGPPVVEAIEIARGIMRIVDEKIVIVSAIEGPISREDVLKMLAEIRFSCNSRMILAKKGSF